MPRHRLRRLLHQAIAGIEADFDRIGGLLARGEGHDRKVQIVPYTGYRNGERARVKGRVLRYREPGDVGAGTMARMRAMLSIYNSRELAGVEVRASGYGETLTARTSDEGYFEFEFGQSGPLPERTAWERVLLSAPGRGTQAGEVAVPVLAPGTDNHWGIISDLDDTVVETGATNFLKNWRRVLVDRPGDRVVVPGAADLYGTIAGNHVDPVRPFFYVSSSPWNLFDYIADFMELNGIPHGPMFLKDYGIDAEKLIRPSHGEHKLRAIETVLDFYPGFRFLLIGDSGQHDVEIYAQAVRDFPARVGAVFIRDVNGSCAEDPKAALLAGIREAGVPTFCGAGFGDAVAIAKSLDLDRPIEAAKAAVAAR